MKELKFRVWHHQENKMYYRGYQKLFHVLLCEKDPLDEDGSGRPVKRAGYGDCFFLESTGLEDRHRKEIFEGDIVRVRHQGREFVDVVGSVPDMFGSRKLHPLAPLLKKHGISGHPDNRAMEVLGNEFEHPELLKEVESHVHGQRSA